MEQIEKLDRWIKSYLEIEGIDFEDLSKVNLDDRTEYILRLITK